MSKTTPSIIELPKSNNCKKKYKKKLIVKKINKMMALIHHLIDILIKK